MPQSFIKKIFNSKKINSDIDTSKNNENSQNKKLIQTTRFSSMLQKYLCGCNSGTKLKRQEKNNSKEYMITKVQQDGIFQFLQSWLWLSKQFFFGECG